MVIGDLETLGEIVLAKATGLIELRFGRDMERESDIRGVELLVKAGIDPRGLRSFFARLAEKQGVLLEKLAIVSSHPASSERVQYLDELMARAGEREYRSFDLDWAALKQRLKEGSPQ
jgi:predicted Zn-dependent protease